jgi:hypothetical protein
MTLTSLNLQPYEQEPGKLSRRRTLLWFVIAIALLVIVSYVIAVYF